MRAVDFEKLADQYAGFLVAVGGVSITVLALIFGVADEATKATEIEARLSVVAALIVAAVCCFVGAHMMAETAAFFAKVKEEKSLPLARISLGQRLFVMATANIFVGITLVLFAVVLLPRATGETVLADRIRPISCAVFLCVAGGALVWMYLAGLARTVAEGRDARKAMVVAVSAGTVGGGVCYALVPLTILRPLIFIFIAACIFASVIYFAVTFKSGKARSPRYSSRELLFFATAVAFSNASLVAAYFKMW